MVNTPEWRRAEIPSTNSHASARGVARFYAGILDGRVLSAETVAALTEIRADGPDLVLERPSRFGAGFQLPQPERPFGTGPRAFGHFGAGGSLGFADPDAGVAFGYVMGELGPRWQNPRNRALLDAVVHLPLTVHPSGQVRRSRHSWRMAWLRAWSARPGWLVQRATATRASGSRVKYVSKPLQSPWW